MFNLRLINQVKIQITCAPPVTYSQYDMDIHDFNRVMVNVSIVLSQDIIMVRLIGNMRFYVTKRDMQQLQMKFTTSSLTVPVLSSGDFHL